MNFAKVLSDSLSPRGVRLLSMECTFPRFILAEVNTHRVLSRNSASSRAIPVANRIAAVLSDPFIPLSFGLNKAGMQAGEALGEEEQRLAVCAWLRARDACVREARILADLKAHKQHANRLLEVFSWHTAVITSTEWGNFFALRRHPDAQPEFRDLAECMFGAMMRSTPRVVRPGEVHRIYVDDLKELQRNFTEDEIDRISIGRAARVSYLTHDGTRDPMADLALASRLLTAGHMSPFEHVARPFDWWDRVRHPSGFAGNFRGWTQYRKGIRHEGDFSKMLETA